MSVKEAKLYSGVIDEPRLYDIEKLAAAGIQAKRPLPSVTTILRVINKPAFVPAALKAMGDYLLEHWGDAIPGPAMIAEAKKAWGARSRIAMDFGTQIHLLAEKHGRTGSREIADDAPDEVKNGFAAYLSWIDKSGFVATEIEKVIGDPVEGYAGCCDAVGILKDGTRVMVDWKSGKGGSIYNEYLLQWHAYARPLGIEQGFIVSFDKETGECYQKEMKFDSRTMRAFFAARDLYEWMERDKE